MKKTLIAIAALAATSAFAQSTVTLSGNLDVAYGTASKGTAAAEKTISTRDLTASTSVIKIIAVEDLGGGTSATVQYGLDPRKLVRENAALASDESFVGLAGAMGNVRLGQPNSIGLTTFAVGSPMGTGIGSGYGTNVVGYTSNIRYTRSARYDSPSFSGLTVSLLKAQGSDAAVAGTLPATAADIAVAVAGRTEMGVAYANGPLNIAYANVKAEKYSTTDAARSVNTLAANYKLGATTVYVGSVTGDSLAVVAGTTTTKGSSFAVKHTMGQIDLMAGVNQRKDSGSETVKITGVRADYNLSKTAAAYAGYQFVNATGTTNDQKLTAIGLKKSF